VPERKPPPKPEPAQSRVWLDLSEEERRLFAQEFADVAPLRKGANRVLLESCEAHKAVDASPARGVRKDDALVVDRQDGSLTGASYGVSHETVRALARGDIHVESTCDLHGLGAEAARHRIQQFIRESACAGRRAVLVICGRGKHSGGQSPVLRDVTVDELCRRPTLAHVLAFSTAAPARGGEGALAILLRRPAKTE